MLNYSIFKAKNIGTEISYWRNDFYTKQTIHITESLEHKQMYEHGIFFSKIVHASQPEVSMLIKSYQLTVSLSY